MSTGIPAFADGYDGLLPMIPIDSLVQAVQLDIPKCPSVAVRAVVRDVIRDWCRTAWSVSRTFMVSGDAADFWDVDFTGLLGGMRIIRIGQAHIRGQEVRFVERDDVPPLGRAFFDGKTDNIRGYRIGNTGQEVTLYHVSGAPLVLTLVLEPASDATSVPEILDRLWRRPIISGVKARLMEMANKPWSNPQMAVFHWGVHADGLSCAIGHHIRDRQTRKGKRWL